jgi:hypothetical protein
MRSLARPVAWSSPPRSTSPWPITRWSNRTFSTSRRSSSTGSMSGSKALPTWRSRSPRPAPCGAIAARSFGPTPRWGPGVLDRRPRRAADRVPHQPRGAVPGGGAARRRLSLAGPTGHRPRSRGVLDRGRGSVPGLKVALLRGATVQGTTVAGGHSATALQLSDLSGYFWFFDGDDDGPALRAPRSAPPARRSSTRTPRGRTRTSSTSGPSRSDGSRPRAGARRGS